MGAAAADDGTLLSSPVLDNVEANHLKLSTLSGPNWLRMLGNISVIAASNTVISLTAASGPTRPPTLSGMGNEYPQKYGNALWLGSKGRYGGSFHLWIKHVGGR